MSKQNSEKNQSNAIEKIQKFQKYAIRFFMFLVFPIVTIIWLILGTLAWIPLLFRMTVFFSTALIKVAGGKANISSAEKALEIAIAFPIKGFTTISKVWVSMWEKKKEEEKEEEKVKFIKEEKKTTKERVIDLIWYVLPFVIIAIIYNFYSIFNFLKRGLFSF